VADGQPLRAAKQSLQRNGGVGCHKDGKQRQPNQLSKRRLGNAPPLGEHREQPQGQHAAVAHKQRSRRFLRQIQQNSSGADSALLQCAAEQHQHSECAQRRKQQPRQNEHEQVKAAKPLPKGLLKATKKYGVPAKNTCLIGDQLFTTAVLMDAPCLTPQLDAAILRREGPRLAFDRATRIAANYIVR